MLIITRKKGSNLRLTTKEIDIKIKILDVHNGSARLSIDAPLSVDISRDDMKKNKQGQPRNDIKQR